MLTLLKPSFAHRHNPDGSHDSICTKCYHTVETAIEEEDLAAAERSHDCYELLAIKTRQGAKEDDSRVSS
jgi:hypothetical protein